MPNEDFDLIKSGVMATESRLSHGDRSNEALRLAVLELSAALTLLTEIVYQHIEFDEPMHDVVRTQSRGLDDHGPGYD